MSDQKQDKPQDKPVVQEKGRFEEFAPPRRTVVIRGEEHELRELSLAEKIRIVGPLAETALRSVTVKRADGGLAFDIPERFSLSDLKIDQLILGSATALLEVLRLSVPGFGDWDGLSESEVRGPLLKVMEVNDFLGFVLNFISVAGKAMSSPRL